MLLMDVMARPHYFACCTGYICNVINTPLNYVHAKLILSNQHLPCCNKLTLTPQATASMSGTATCLHEQNYRLNMCKGIIKILAISQ